MTSALTCFTWTPFQLESRYNILYSDQAETSPHSGRLPNVVDCGIL